MYTPGSPLYALSFDVDATLSPPNQLIDGVYLDWLKALQETPGIEVILNSGKSAPYLERNAVRFNGRYLVVCNGAACQVIGGDQVIYGGKSEDLQKLSELLGLTHGSEGVQKMQVGDHTYEIAIEEDKHDLVLTIFCEPEWVSHRWQFAGGIDRNALYDHLNKLIADNDLNLHVLSPHGDGAVDIVRMADGKPIDKSTLPNALAQMWPGVELHIAMWGDGSNDVPAMTAPGVRGITFPEANDEKVQKPVQRAGGIITKRPAWTKNGDTWVAGGGPLEGMVRLCDEGFFGELTDRVRSLTQQLLTAFPRHPQA